MSTKNTRPIIVFASFIAIAVFVGIYILRQKELPAEVITPEPMSQELTENSLSDTEEQRQEVSENFKTARQVPFVNESTTFSYAETNPTVIFFKASWCPTCQAAQRDIDQNFSELPQDLVIVIADYDTEKQLKDRYGITYQHTWVQVDSEGNVLAKWNGGAVSELNQNIIR